MIREIDPVVLEMDDFDVEVLLDDSQLLGGVEEGHHDIVMAFI
jgi:hypothetical protein